MHNNYQVFVSSGGGGGPQEVGLRRPGGPTVQFSNLADFNVYLTLISLSKINLYHRFKLWSRSARFSDDLQI